MSHIRWPKIACSVAGMPRGIRDNPVNSHGVEAVTTRPLPRPLKFSSHSLQVSPPCRMSLFYILSVVDRVTGWLGPALVVAACRAPEIPPCPQCPPCPACPGAPAPNCHWPTVARGSWLGTALAVAVGAFLGVALTLAAWRETYATSATPLGLREVRGRRALAPAPSVGARGVVGG